MTSIVGGYLPGPWAPVEQTGLQGVDVDWLLVTDDPAPDAPLPWDVHTIERAPNESPRLASKVARCRPFTFAPEADVAIWLDAAGEVTSALFVAELLGLLGDGEFAAFAHPDRDCVYAEASATMALPKYSDEIERLADWVQWLHAEGWPEHAGLWCGTLTVQRNTPSMRAAGLEELILCRAGAENDQLALPVALSRWAVEPVTIPGDVWRNPWITWHRPEGTFSA